MPQISILLPVFNGARFLDEQLRSVLSQSFDDFELLIHNDGSTDDSSITIAHFSQLDHRIKSSRSDVNEGQLFTLSRLIEQCSGKFVMFCDQDDIWHPEKIQNLIASKGPSSLVYGRSELIDANGDSLGKSIFDYVGPPITGANRLDLFFRNTISAHALMVDRAILDTSLVKFDKLYDKLIALTASLVDGIVYEPSAITFHRIHPSNQVNHTLVDGPGRAYRVGRRRRLLNFSTTLLLLSAHPALKPAQRSALASMHERTSRKICESRLRFFRDSDFGMRLGDLARQLSQDPEALDYFNERIRKFARGSLPFVFR